MINQFTPFYEWANFRQFEIRVGWCKHQLYKDLLPLLSSSSVFLSNSWKQKGIQGQAERMKILITILVWADKFTNADHFQYWILQKKRSGNIYIFHLVSFAKCWILLIFVLLWLYQWAFKIITRFKLIQKAILYE